MTAEGEHRSHSPNDRDEISEADRLIDRLLSELSQLEAIPFPEEVAPQIQQIPYESAEFAKQNLPRKIGPYQLMAPLGSGGMGSIFRVRHESLGNEVALKIIRPDRILCDSANERFFREMRALASMEHPHVVRAYDGGTDGGFAYLAMELIQGCDLKRLSETKELSVSQCCELIRQSALGLAAVHQAGLVHRDIKPANLMLTTQGLVKVVDFGLAISMEEGSDITASQVIVGSGKYISPEQRLGMSDVDHRSDIYSLGRSLQSLLPEAKVPNRLQKLLRRLLMEDRSQRLQSAIEIADRLREFCESDSIQAALQRLLVGEENLSSDSGSTSQFVPLASENRSSDVYSGLVIRRKRDRSRNLAVLSVGTLLVATIGISAWMPDFEIKPTTDGDQLSTEGNPIVNSATEVSSKANREVSLPDGLKNEVPISEWLLCHGASVTVNFFDGTDWIGKTPDDPSEFSGKTGVIQVVDIHAVDDPSEHLQKILQLQELRGLIANSEKITDEILGQCHSQWELHWIYIPSSSATDQGISSLVKYKECLENLDISDASVSRKAIEVLSSFSKLRELVVQRTSLTDSDLDLLTQMESLMVLDLSGTQVTDASVQYLAECPHLKRLKLRQTSLTDQGLKGLSGLDLTSLDVRQTAVTQDGIDHFRERKPACKILYGSAF
ncbi:protein kinase domain-containing protein [Rubinisphaera margarita]|uniref:protein kinase domain-containing protein n=1 Tax=Rubinisphaera margarita TaxID=2909586 RepID=UPI001EE88D80|nr:protein kinase [Rubinisphaera margarita]MCG6154644.1 protein kinase [Rubinisphaera margarita]